MLRFTILVVFAPYFSWEIPIFAPFLPPIFAKNAPYSALYLSVLAPYRNVVSMVKVQTPPNSSRTIVELLPSLCWMPFWHHGCVAAGHAQRSSVDCSIK